MTARSFDAIIIGTGQAGAPLAGRLSAAGLSVAIVERHLVGGTCVNTGCKPTKTLVASAYAAHMARRGAALVVVTASGGRTASDAIRGLKPRGKVIVLGASPEPVEASTADLLFGGRSVEGALTGDPATGDATLRFSVLTGVSPMVETMPLERAPEAYARMMAGQARFRIVLTMTGNA